MVLGTPKITIKDGFEVIGDGTCFYESLSAAKKDRKMEIRAYALEKSQIKIYKVSLLEIKQEILCD